MKKPMPYVAAWLLFLAATPALSQVAVQITPYAGALSLPEEVYSGSINGSDFTTRFHPASAAVLGARVTGWLGRHFAFEADGWRAMSPVLQSQAAAGDILLSRYLSPPPRDSVHYLALGARMLLNAPLPWKAVSLHFSAGISRLFRQGESLHPRGRFETPSDTTNVSFPVGIGTRVRVIRNLSLRLDLETVLATGSFSHFWIPTPTRSLKSRGLMVSVGVTIPVVGVR
jgi:hypothetical protein